MPLTSKDIPHIVARVKVKELIRRTQPIVRVSVEHFGRRASTQISSSVVFNMNNPRISEFLRRYGADRMTKVNRTTRNRVRTILARGVEKGKTNAAIASDLRHVFDHRNPGGIAATEIHRASSFASLEGYKQAGVEQKEWQATQDDLVRESHEEMDGQVVDVDDDFVSGAGNTAPYPGEFGVPEEDINCRCGVLPVVDGRRLWARGIIWKWLDRERAPYARRMASALSQAFATQLDAVLEELDVRAA